MPIVFGAEDEMIKKEELSKFQLADIRKIKRLREYYRREFVNGDSDECFKMWIEDLLTDLNKLESEEHGG